MSTLRGIKSATNFDEDLLKQHEAEMWGEQDQDDKRDNLNDAGDDDWEVVEEGPTVEVTDEQRDRMLEKKKEALRKAAERKAQRAEAAAAAAAAAEAEKENTEELDEDELMMRALEEAEMEHQRQRDAQAAQEAAQEAAMEMEEQIAEQVLQEERQTPKRTTNEKPSKHQRPPKPSSPVAMDISQDNVNLTQDSGVALKQMEGTAPEETVRESATQDSGAQLAAMEGTELAPSEEPAEESGSQQPERSRRTNAGRAGRVTASQKAAISALASQKSALERLKAAREASKKRK